MNLSKKEFMLCVDSTNAFALWDEESYPVKSQGLTVKDQVLANVRDSILIEKLDEKWSVNAKEFLAKMEAGSEEQYKELWKRIQDFWDKRDKEGAENNE